MNVNLEKRCTEEFSEATVLSLAKELSLHPLLIKLILSRGLETSLEMHKFLHPNRDNMHDPFLMKGMREAVARIYQAIENDEKVVVYGDYDVDGICSTAILSLYLKSKGLNVYVHIPSRTDEGYGLNIASIENIIEDQFPDLILTCDCGISGIEEVNCSKELGVDIIVTDHHEVGGAVPECVVVNPKQADCNYPDKYLCGAGVAIKLVQALCGDDAFMKYIDLACIATIADLVPLMNENRLIVQLGLKTLAKKQGNLGLRMLLETFCKECAPTSGDIAYKIAPRLNAAGRIGDAYRAFDILVSNDKSEIALLIKQIDADNEKRKELCEKTYQEAVADLAYEDLVNNRALILSNPEWSKGITGIVAARLAGDFNRPTFIIVDTGDGETYKGTVRSIRNINIYDVLADAADLLIEFGGHSGAAGFSIRRESIPEFRKRVNEYLARLPQEQFLPTITYDLELSLNEISIELYNELNLIEPTGNSNAKPLFKINASTLSAVPCKNVVHTMVSVGNLRMFAFNFYNKNHLFTGEQNKELVVELCAGQGSSVNGYIKAINTQSLCINETLAVANYLNGLRLRDTAKTTVKKYEKTNLGELLPQNIYGTLFICGSERTYNDFINKFNVQNIIMHDYFRLSDQNNYSGIIVSPIFDDEFVVRNYSKIVFLDSPMSCNVISFIRRRTEAEIYVATHDNSSAFFADVSSERDVFGAYYNTIVSNPELSSDNVITYYKRLSAKQKNLTPAQFIICKLVFEELGLIEYKSGKLTISEGIKRPLADSDIYKLVLSQNK